MTLPAHDRALWDGLIAKILNPKIRDVAVIHKAAKRAQSAQMPVSEWSWQGGRIVYDPISPFLKLTALGRILPGGNDLQRQVLCDLAHACRARMERRPDPTVPPAANNRAAAPPSAWQERKDING